MDLKETVINTIKELPDTSSLSDIINAIYIKAKAIAGMKDIENGNFSFHEDLKKEVEAWK